MYAAVTAKDGLQLRWRFVGVLRNSRSAAKASIHDYCFGRHIYPVEWRLLLKNVRFVTWRK